MNMARAETGILIFSLRKDRLTDVFIPLTSKIKFLLTRRSFDNQVNNKALVERRSVLLTASTGGCSGKNLEITSYPCL